MGPEQEEFTETGIGCEICGGSMPDFYILPLKQPDGKLNTLACCGCAEKSGAFCITHHHPHLGFEDETSACTECIEEKVEADSSKIIVRFFQEIENSPHKESVLEELEKWSQVLSRRGSPHSDINISRAIVTSAFRFDTTPEEIINQVCEEGVEIILPDGVRKMVDLLQEPS